MTALYITYDEKLFPAKTLKAMGLQLTIRECNASIGYLEKLRETAEIQLQVMRNEEKKGEPNQ